MAEFSRRLTTSWPIGFFSAVFVVSLMSGCKNSVPLESWPPEDVAITRWSDDRHIWRDAYVFAEKDRRRFDLGEISEPMRLRVGFYPGEVQERRTQLRVLVGDELFATLAPEAESTWIDRLIDIPVPEEGPLRVIVEVDSGRRSGAAVSEMELYPADSKHSTPNILIILVDTLRRDHVSCYGYARDTTPHIDRLAGESAKFTHMISQAPWTSPSVASMFSGYRPELHGVVSWNPHYSDGLPTITEALVQNGYATLAFSANGHTHPKRGFDRGFQHFTAFYNRHEGGRDEYVVDAAIREIGGVVGRPWFAHLHLIGPHSPYEPLEQYWERYQDPARPVDREELARIMQNSNNTGMGWLFKKVCHWNRSDWEPVPGDTRADITSLLIESELKELAIALYDAEIRYTDEQIGRLLDFLRDEGEFENTLILFVSDHGEEHWDHGEVHHNHTLYNELLSVPLVIKPPGRSRVPTIIDDIVEMIDLAPTIADYAGVDLGWRTQGQSLRPALEGRAIAPRLARSSLSSFSRLAAVDMQLVRLHLRCVQDQSRKVIFDELSGRLRFYDLVADPFEQHPLYEAPEDFGPLIRTLQEMALTNTQGLNVLFCAPRDRAATLKGTVEIADSGQAGFQSSAVQGSVVRREDGWDFEINVRPSEDHHPESPRFNPVFYIPCPSDQSARITLLLDGEPIEPDQLHLYQGTGATLSADMTITLNQHAGRVREYIGAAVQDRPSVYVWYGVENLTVGVDSRDSEFDEEMRALGYL